MFWIIILIAVVVFVLLGISGLNNIKDNNKILEKNGFSVELKTDTAKYIAGHPDLDNSLKLTAIFPKDDQFYVFEYPEGLSYKMPEKRTIIPIKSIKNISAEDATTIEKKLTVGRLLAVGIFAFALKKKHKNELAYLTIEWSDGKFNHETYFEYEGKEAMQKANTARNKLIRFIGQLPTNE